MSPVGSVVKCSRKWRCVLGYLTDVSVSLYNVVITTIAAAAVDVPLRRGDLFNGRRDEAARFTGA
jgi:hypothetical protein